MGVNMASVKMWWISASAISLWDGEYSRLAKSKLNSAGEPRGRFKLGNLTGMSSWMEQRLAWVYVRNKAERDLDGVIIFSLLAYMSNRLCLLTIFIASCKFNRLCVSKILRVVLWCTWESRKNQCFKYKLLYRRNLNKKERERKRENV